MILLQADRNSTLLYWTTSMEMLDVLSFSTLAVFNPELKIEAPL